jgi:excisionase family DNA binding protein
MRLPGAAIHERAGSFRTKSLLDNPAPAAAARADSEFVGGGLSMPRPPATVLEPLLTIAQTAELLQVSQKTIRRRIADRSLVAHRIGGQWRLARCDIDEYLRSARHGQ